MVAKFSAEPLDLPKTVGRPVAMAAKFSAEPLDLPKTVGRPVAMVAKFSAEPLDVPKTVGRPVAMVAKFSAETLDVPKTVGRPVAMEAKFSAEPLDVPKTVGRPVAMVAKFSAEPLDLPKTVGRPVAMVANFSAEPLDLPKDSVVGTAEEMTESIVAMLDCNNGRPSGEGTTKSTPNKVNSKTKQYLRDSLAHLSDEERAETEPVLMRYAHVFHGEESGEFGKTDLVRHRIETGNAPAIRKAPYRVPH
jgi:hypothetical protein